MKCRNCGTDNLKEAEFCEKCGTSLSEKNLCSNCGYKNKPSAQHCIKCGTKLKHAELKTRKLEAEAKPESQEGKNKKAIPPILWILAGLFGVIILFLAAILLGFIQISLQPENETSILPANTMSLEKSAQQSQPDDSNSLPAKSLLQEDYVEILFNCNESGMSPVIASIEDKIYVFIKWTASTQTQSVDFLKYIKFAVSENGNPINFQGPFFSEISYDQQNSLFITTPLVVLPAFAVGTHHIKTEITWSQKFFDGQAYYGPGGNFTKLEGNCTIIVNQTVAQPARPKTIPPIVDNQGKPLDCLSVLEPLANEIKKGYSSLCAINGCGIILNSDAPLLKDVTFQCRWFLGQDQEKMVTAKDCKTFEDGGGWICTCEDDTVNHERMGLVLNYQGCKMMGPAEYNPTIEQPNQNPQSTFKCPSSAENIRGGNVKWSKGILTFEVINIKQPDWLSGIEAINGSLLDGAGREWGKVECNQDSDGRFYCSGPLSFKTGSASLTLTIGECQLSGIKTDLCFSHCQWPPSD